MAKAEWGKKHTCPKCGTRFYDLGKKGAAVCIECEHKWVPEPILKAKQPHVAPPKPVEEPAKPAADKSAPDSAEASNSEEDSDVAAVKGLEVEVEDDAKEKEDGVLGDVSLDDNGGDLSGVVDTKLEKGADS